MIQHETRLRVRYAETDQMGYCYYGNYAQYFEVARAEMIRSLGFTYKDMEAKHDTLMPVMSLNIRYVRPALYDEELRLMTTLRKLPSKTVTFYTEVYNEKSELVCGGSVKLGFITSAKGEGIEAPEVLLEKLRPHFEDTES